MPEDVRVIAAESVRDFQSFMDLDGPTIADGDVLPIGWHWIALAQWVVSKGLGEDGHPAGVHPADSAFSRRMFAGGEIIIHQNVHVGDQVTMRTAEEDRVRKSGSAGEFDLKTERFQILDDQGVLCIEERRDIVYLPPRPPENDSSAVGAQSMGRSGPLTRVDGTWRLQTDPVLLMRFSALTANAHRIHYDAPYARHVEGYPGLVVHGPLMTLMLLEVLRREHGPGLTHVRHRNIAPLFCGQHAVVELNPPRSSHDGRASLSSDGVVLVTVAYPSSTERSTPCTNMSPPASA